MIIQNALPVTDMARNLADYINRVAYRGEQFTIMRGKKVVAELRPVSRGRPLSELPALLAALPHLTPTELDDFERDLGAMREVQKQESLRDPWASF